MRTEYLYLALVVGLFLVPRLLQRFRIPTAITSVALGAFLGIRFHLFAGDTTIPMLATLGIVSLFLFAGLEVSFSELRQGAKVVASHLVIQVGLLTLGTALAMQLFRLDVRPAALFSLAIFTPSCGFILDSLTAFGLNDDQRFWVKTKAIASELVALTAMFFTIQSGDVRALGLSTFAIVVLVAVLPLIFLIFAKLILPFAPKSEFTFLVILAFASAALTRHLGVYYLVGAFVVGVTAVRLRKRLPALASARLTSAVELFASFFIPFYFFKAGLHLERHYFTGEALLIGAGLVAVAVPVRIAVVALHRKVTLGESLRGGFRVGLSLVPTLVFSLVLADILHEQYHLPDYLYGAILVFALTNTILPGLILRASNGDFEHLAASEAFLEDAGPRQERADAPVPSSESR